MNKSKHYKKVRLKVYCVSPRAPRPSMRRRGFPTGNGADRRPCDDLGGLIWVRPYAKTPRNCIYTKLVSRRTYWTSAYAYITRWVAHSAPCYTNQSRGSVYRGWPVTIWENDSRLKLAYVSWRLTGYQSIFHLDSDLVLYGGRTGDWYLTCDPVRWSGEGFSVRWVCLLRLIARKTKRFGTRGECKFLFVPLLKKIIPALGPLRVLWTVEVTISQYSNGEGTFLVATRPKIKPQ